MTAEEPEFIGIRNPDYEEVFKGTINELVEFVNGQGFSALAKQRTDHQYGGVGGAGFSGRTILFDIYTDGWFKRNLGSIRLLAFFNGGNGPDIYNILFDDFNDKSFSDAVKNFFEKREMELACQMFRVKIPSVMYEK